MYAKEVENSDLKKARQSVIEEFEAINWYENRIEEAKDAELKKILEHNKNEEKEHAAMLVEWIRKKDKEQDKAFEEHD
ncbi:MAG: ferritin [Candidatus Aenigmarchaeota archaeon CG_4_10_14_0_8_um_filter_37_24]|nr:ferritin [Candidatus Aenigmarchaeota archaeon]OIN88015.1 MAG: hypothetical protein AUJ50_02010 [Candidatus Aenigmarchaeota archaeon CG1_02_38_14]OIP34489.1 MAG: hypothetical protein AUK23_01630 [Deltaproteobacteria bacterium CG2_30_43_15]PIV68995.1 MAG: ferritin [Candidatus Aenigmarchaeota archaeon CG01_land_8_20_14_3_00_37_9]PIW41627.1 MAG: ferritin [Candidatus Aenigmarchaeota archaeon CG15_BIG_FIL_POST_REV_8_21_14_020_37_27]PIX50785.1 MAG: ferritin [Candidatus Aenigmarchaeota archaeon CG_